MSPIRLSSLLCFLVLCVNQSYARNYKSCLYSEHIPSMGTVFQIQYLDLCAKTTDERQKLVLEIQNLLDALEAPMSLYQTNSQINSLNQQGEIKNAAPSFVEVVKIALQQGTLTDGAFDITVWPVLKKIQHAFEKTKKPPPLAELDQLRELVSYRLVAVKGRDISFQKEGVMITLDGIAKGYAVDQVAQYLNSKKIENFLANFSGNMKAQGLNIQKQAWTIAIENPLNPSQLIPVDLKNGAVATSSAEFEYYSNDKKWAHIIDPRTLQPSSELASATALGRSATICDVLGKTILVLGITRAEQLFSKNYPNYRFVAVLQNGTVHRFPSEQPATTEKSPIPINKN